MVDAPTCSAAYPTQCGPASLFTAVVLSQLKFETQAQQREALASPSAGTDYDFIVVGGGSAGSVVASRLSENLNWNVLLLEAGPEEPLLDEVPAFNRFFLRTEFDWQFQTEPSGWDPGQYIPRGRSLGGSSAINGMLYSRGNREDYDRWEQMGNKGWSYKDVLPFFKKSENNLDIGGGLLGKDAKFHGAGGPLQVQHFPFRDENVDIVLKAFAETGHAFNPDHAGASQNGSTLLQFTQGHGRRSSTNRAFITPVRRLRPNLSVHSLSPVRRIVINPRTKRAVGVEYESPRGRRSARARREVILSAGALQSPQLLMLSGIGDFDQIREAGIKPVHELPMVGKNLLDHLTSAYTVNFTLTKTATERLDSLPQRNADFTRYQDRRDGPLSATGIRQVAAFFRTKFQRPGPTRPHIHIEIIGQLTNPEKGKRCPNCTFPKEDSLWYDQLRFSPVMLHPQYAGQVRLNPKDPHSKPLVFLNISLTEVEMKTWLEGYRAVAQLNESAAFREHGITLDTPPIHGCPDGVVPASDEYWKCAGRLGAQTWGHLISTCRMGKGPADSVVDSQLRVHGIKALRVVDASVMPSLPSGNTNGPTIMIGEKGANLIWKTHSRASIASPGCC